MSTYEQAVTPNDNKRKDKIVLISRLKTQNAGNEALSVEFINFFQELLSDAELRAIDRYPQYLYAFRLNRLGKSEHDIITSFDAVVSKIAQAFKNAGALAPIAKEELVKLNLTGKELPKAVAKIKRLIGVRRRLSHLGLVGRETMASSVATCRWADKLVWNPAGEIHPTGNSDEVLRLLILVRLAQLNGAETYIVNHSLEIADEKLRYLIKHVYSHASCIVLRDKQSCAETLKLGVSAERIREVPDMVFLSAESDVKRAPPADEAFPVGAIGLAINGLEAERGSDEWDELMTGLKSFERPIVFLSNAMNHDLPFARKLALKHPLTVLERQPTYREIRGFYGNLSILVSSRLHSSIIALSESVPVLTIEPSTFKLTGIFEQLDYPYPTLKLNQPGWAKRMLDNIDRALHDSELGALGKSRCIQKSQQIRASYGGLFLEQSKEAAAPLTQPLAQAAV